MVKTTVQFFEEYFGDDTVVIIIYQVRKAFNRNITQFLQQKLLATCVVPSFYIYKNHSSFESTLACNWLQVWPRPYHRELDGSREGETLATP